ncbi:hypothetical protein CEXT_115561 [Caerostris extrusa]|uniref:Uncharacterized protein n=1 Tax=Caerostris extrusa TaxID=172846 RepID=A0AAV4TJZ1_CAEEX|nr:hypothetical protein CEXT_115561 [Caerostris extrusa]
MHDIIACSFRAIAGVISGRTTWHVMGMGRKSRTQYEPTTLRDRKRGDPKEKTECSNDEKDDYEPTLIRGKKTVLGESIAVIFKDTSNSFVQPLEILLGLPQTTNTVIIWNFVTFNQPVYLWIRNLRDACIIDTAVVMNIDCGYRGRRLSDFGICLNILLKIPIQGRFLSGLDF